MKSKSLVIKSLLVVLLFGMAFSLSAQSSEFMAVLLQQDSLTVGQAAYLVLVASENLGDDADEQRSFDLLESLGWAPRNKLADSMVTMSEYAYMLMKAFNLKGGLFYSLFPSPRYAYRELRYKMIMQGPGDPAMAVDGSMAIRYLGRVFDLQGVSYEL